MDIRRKEMIDDYMKNHADVRKSLQRWVDVVEQANWKSLVDIKSDFTSVDYVGNERYVFDIRWNKYRIVTVVIFVAGTLTVRFVGTHKEYDKINCKTI